jgi:hypothetical protein
VNLDPHHPQSGHIELPLDLLDLDPVRPYQAEDLLGGGRFLWYGARNYVALDPPRAARPCLPAPPTRPDRARLRLLPMRPMRRRAPVPVPAPEREPLWYKDAIVYELRVGAFQDSDGDGIGDFRGLTIGSTT